jgi:drug/metabolite transporter (DMT)-like permease
MGLLMTLFLGSAIQRRTVRARDWLMALVLCSGLTLFLLETSPTQGLDVVPAARWVRAAPLILGAVMLCLALAKTSAGAARGAFLGVAAAILFAASAVLTKAFVHYLGEGLFAWVPHWEPYVMAVVIGCGFVIGQSAFQAGSLAASVAGIEATEPIASVVLGVLLLDETVSIGTPLEAGAVVISVAAVVIGIVSLARSENRPVTNAASPLEVAPKSDRAHH